MSRRGARRAPVLCGLAAPVPDHEAVPAARPVRQLQPLSKRPLAFENVVQRVWLPLTKQTGAAICYQSESISFIDRHYLVHIAVRAWRPAREQHPARMPRDD